MVELLRAPMPVELLRAPMPVELHRAPTPVELHRAPTPVELHRARRDPAVPDDMPLEGPLVDRFGRVHTDLRLSVTDRCNLRCVYCMPEEGLTWLDRSEVLTFEEIARVARVSHGLGVRSVRLTGGEPLQRAHLVRLVRQLAEVGFDDLAMTTNGIGLARHAQELAIAGLRRVNVSCDSLRPDRFAQIRRRGELVEVLAGMAAAEEAGLLPLKVNVVVIRGANDDEIVDLAAHARATGRIVRFIEYMPLDAQRAWSRDSVVSADEILGRIDAVWPLERVGSGERDPAPAERYRFADGVGEIGVVPSVTRAFCGACDRLRLTADGAIRNCLFAHDELSARDVMRAGASDEELARLLRTAAWAKKPGHGINDPGFLQPARSMSKIGG